MSGGLLLATVDPLDPIFAGLVPLQSRKVLWFSGQNITTGAPSTTNGAAWGWNSFASSGTILTHPALVSTNRLTATNRVVYSTTSSTTASMGITDNGQLIAWRGNAAGLGGFLFVCRFAIELLGASVPLKTFVGLEGVLGPAATTDWTTDTTISKLGMAFTATTSAGSTLTGNWQIMEGSTAAKTAHDLGANFALTVGDYIELRLWCAQNDTAISYQVKNLTTGNTATGTLNTTIPANTVFLTPYAQMNVAAGGSGTTRFSISMLYLECYDG